MKKLYFLDEEEKNRILNIHESATKRQYLSEQQIDRQSNITKTYCSVKNGIITAKDSKLKDTKWDDYVSTYKITQAEIDIAKKSCVGSPEDRIKNITKVYCSVKNGIITTGSYNNIKWVDYVKDFKVTNQEIETAKKSCPKTNNSPQNRQQIIDRITNTTKGIQELLGLEKTGVMDSSLLQKINEKLNGNPQQPSTTDTNAQPRPKVEPLQQLTPAGVNTQQITTPNPEQLTAGLQQMQQKAAAATAGLKR